MTPIPQSVVSRAERLCQYMPKKDVAALLGLHPSAISAMAARGWKAGIGGPAPRPRPGDFSYYANRMTFAQLLRHYRAGNRTVRRWISETPNVAPPKRGGTWRPMKPVQSRRRAQQSTTVENMGAGA